MFPGIILALERRQKPRSSTYIITYSIPILSILSRVCLPRMPHTGINLFWLTTSTLKVYVKLLWPLRLAQSISIATGENMSYLFLITWICLRSTRRAPPSPKFRGKNCRHVSFESHNLGSFGDRYKSPFWPHLFERWLKAGPFDARCFLANSDSFEQRFTT